MICRLVFINAAATKSQLAHSGQCTFPAPSASTSDSAIMRSLTARDWAKKSVPQGSDTESLAAQRHPIYDEHDASKDSSQDALELGTNEYR